MQERVYIVRRCREVDEPREQREMSRGRFRGGPCPRGAGVRWFVLCVRDGDVGDLVARGRTQSDDVRERVADHLQVRIDGRRGSGMCCASELTA